MRSRAASISSLEIAPSPLVSSRCRMRFPGVSFPWPCAAESGTSPISRAAMSAERCMVMVLSLSLVAPSWVLAATADRYAGRTLPLRSPAKNSRQAAGPRRQTIKQYHAGSDGDLVKQTHNLQDQDQQHKAKDGCKDSDPKNGALLSAHGFPPTHIPCPPYERLSHKVCLRPAEGATMTASGKKNLLPGCSFTRAVTSFIQTMRNISSF